MPFFILAAPIIAKMLSDSTKLAEPKPELQQKLRWMNVTIANETQFNISVTRDRQCDWGRFEDAPSSVPNCKKSAFSVCNRNRCLTGVSGKVKFMLQIPNVMNIPISIAFCNPLLGDYQIRAEFTDDMDVVYDRMDEMPDSTEGQEIQLPGEYYAKDEEGEIERVNVKFEVVPCAAQKATVTIIQTRSIEVQESVFTKWLNWKLTKTGIQVQYGRLHASLEDGLVLLHLMKVLVPGKKLEYHKKPSKVEHKTENLTKVLGFITNSEGVDLGDIEVSDIEGHDLQKVLHLVESLILHYHLKMSKEALLQFLNQILPGRNISNFTTDWKDGSNLEALISYYRPDLKINTPLSVTDAMVLANSELSVPMLLMAEDLAARKPDELSVRMYVSCFFDDLHIKECIRDAPVGIPLQFTVETSQTPVESSELSVVARSKHESDIHGEVEQQGKEGKYNCSITINETGKYKIHVRRNRREISGSPFHVHLMPAPVAAYVGAYGPGLQDGFVGQSGNFVINVAKAGHGSLSVKVTGPKGAFSIHMKDHPKKKGAILAQYNPLHAGKFTINVLWAGAHIPGSPFSVNIQENEGAAKTNDGDSDLPLHPGEFLSYSANDTTYLVPSLGPETGNLYITNYRMCFKSASSNKPDEEHTLNVPLGMISRVKRKGRSWENQCILKIYCKDLRTLQFANKQETLDRLYEKLQTLAFPLSCGRNLFAYNFGGSHPEDGWEVYNAENEMKRLMHGLDPRNVPWRITHVNKSYTVCETYPALLGVPAACSDEDIRTVAKFRSKGRLPVLSWLHPVTGASITRCSQPQVGLLMKRCPEDEAYIQAIHKANKHAKKIYIMDARPWNVAFGNVMIGGGYESQDNYSTVDISFLGIDNIHTMRESLRKVQKIFLDEDDHDQKWFLSKLKSSHWLDYIKMILDGSVKVVKTVEELKSSVIVHCGDGWDRSAQLTTLAMLMLDPFHRTIRGFEILVEKEWLSIGHKFSQRIGHGDKNYDDGERSPIFLQFIDCVWQMTNKFPCAFEFNELFLITILDHLYSCLYGTFLGNCEKDRVDGNVKQRTVSLWGLFSTQMERFKNPEYSEQGGRQVLYPSTDNLQLWIGYYGRWNPKQNQLREQCQKTTEQ